VTSISVIKRSLGRSWKMIIFLFSRWDMLVPRRVQGKPVEIKPTRLGLQTLDIHGLRRMSANRFGIPHHNKKTLKSLKTIAVIAWASFIPLLFSKDICKKNTHSLE